MKYKDTMSRKKILSEKLYTTFDIDNTPDTEVRFADAGNNTVHWDDLPKDLQGKVLHCWTETAAFYERFLKEE